ncbi:FKBP-type peptidyl-prolyl cis-trans isomerase [Naasia sp. SYSU D00057]|uniref:FKBP-type peptidyl-prolyl cis-trans isomerase n=1 Tax=Naasia sp. SYSU D00057 TaxID=2817380 RepID=UPI001B30571C|nr:FKBP-type peptidyl-prolyl cis-trans isomerase [Naasia sp. SYSU D00057]
MRRTLPLVSAAVILAALTGCSSDAPDATSTTPATDASAVDVCSAESGSASEAVDVSGDFGATPQVSFDGGIGADTTERTTVIEGSGDEVEPGSTVEVAYTLYNGENSALLASAGFDGAPTEVFSADAGMYLAGLAKTIGCASVGSRVVSVIPPADAFGDTGNESLGITAEQSLVVVMDIQSLVPTKAWGTEEAAPEGLPQVTLAEDGAPTVAIPSTDPPAELQVAVLKKGDGEAVPEGATVTVQYQGVQWDTGEVFDQSWGQTPTSFSLGAVVPGFSSAIAGQTVGSQVLAVIPPALGYGEAAADSTNALAGKTLVFVIDILAVN